jgi:hypothetical protein
MPCWKTPRTTTPTAISPTPEFMLDHWQPRLLLPSLHVSEVVVHSTGDAREGLRADTRDDRWREHENEQLMQGGSEHATFSEGRTHSIL